MGNGPTNNPDFLAALQEATDRGVVIVDCTQCLKGCVNLEDYATGSALARVDVISGFDMTAEAALAKLVYLFSQQRTVAEIRELMQTNLRENSPCRKSNIVDQPHSRAFRRDLDVRYNRAHLSQYDIQRNDHRTN